MLRTAAATVAAATAAASAAEKALRCTYVKYTDDDSAWCGLGSAADLVVAKRLADDGTQPPLRRGGLPSPSAIVDVGATRRDADIDRRRPVDTDAVGAWSRIFSVGCEIRRRPLLDQMW